jgi:glycosyltransferase involved in cell wall biosynthesis
MCSGKTYSVLRGNSLKSKEAKVAVLLPALNEEIAIGSTIDEIRTFLPDAQIIVIDNGSTDSTSKIASDLNVTVIFEPRQGKGNAVRRGLAAIDPEIDLVLMIDADDTYEVKPVLTAIIQMQSFGYGMIIGSRRVNYEDDSGRNPTFRKGHAFGNRFLSKIYRLLFQLDIEDSLSGWRLMSRHFVDSFVSIESGFGIEAELNSHAFVLQCGVSNLDVAYRGRRVNSHSKLSTYRDGIKILRSTLRMFRNERPTLAFNLLAIPWAVSGTLLTSRSFLEYFNSGLVLYFPSLIAGIGFILVGILLWVTGMILERTRILKQTLMMIVFKRVLR